MLSATLEASFPKRSTCFTSARCIRLQDGDGPARSSGNCIVEPILKKGYNHSIAPHVICHGEGSNPLADFVWKLDDFHSIFEITTSNSETDIFGEIAFVESVDLVIVAADCCLNDEVIIGIGGDRTL